MSRDADSGMGEALEGLDLTMERALEERAEDAYLFQGADDADNGDHDEYPDEDIEWPVRLTGATEPDTGL